MNIKLHFFFFYLINEKRKEREKNYSVSSEHKENDRIAVSEHLLVTKNIRLS